ncbi:hypothetical protein H8D57_00960 [bacterium]|nr:hypothetical protein [bacterium]
MEIWIMNTDSGLDWLLPFRTEYNLSLPIMYDLQEIDETFYMGFDHWVFPPLWLIIDKQGIVRIRDDGSIYDLEEIREQISILINE